jgi:hypothetical protein
VYSTFVFLSQSLSTSSPQAVFTEIFLLLEKHNSKTVIKTVALTLEWVYVFKDSFQQMSQPYVKSNLTSIMKHW